MAGGIGTLESVKQIESWIKTQRARVATERTPEGKPVLAAKLFDGGGLFLTLTAAGSPVWRLKYRLGGAEKLLTIGAFPTVGLKDARKARDAARALKDAGTDPVMARRVAKERSILANGTTFADCAADWVEHKKGGWKNFDPDSSSSAPAILERHVLPAIGSLPIAEIDAQLFAALVFKPLTNSRDPRLDTAAKIAGWAGRIFRLAQVNGKFPSDRANPAEIARELIPRRKLKGRRPAFETLPELGDVLRRARQAHLSPAVHVAHRLCAFTAARMGNVISADWSEFDLKAGLWTIPRVKMKAQDRHFDHLVFLGPVIAAEIRAWHALNSAPKAGIVFPSVAGAGRHITHESIEKVYRVTLGLKDRHTPHGWRAAFSTLARDAGFNRDAVELALDHVHDSEVARAYDRGARRPERVKLAAWWNDELARAERGTP